MRLYISADMEGISGVVSRQNLTPEGFEYERARDWMTDALLCVCEAARESGVTEIVVSDSHGNGQNLRFERMPEYVQLVRSWPRPLGMMQGVELGSYGGAILLGYHAAANNPGGTLSHTVSGQLFQDIRINGKSASEAVISAAIGGHHGVPVLMFAGDDVAVAEARADLGDIACATLKSSLGWLSAMHLPAAAAHAALRTAVRDAIERAPAARPFRIQGPVVLDIRLRSRFVAEWLAYLRDVERIDAFTVRHASDDILGAVRFINFLASARAALE